MVRTVFDNAQCAHVWAAQSQPHGRSANGNLYFDSRVIYSYGSHWPLAAFMPEDMVTAEGKRIVIVNGDSYGPTTGGHASDVRGALHGLDVIKLFTRSCRVMQSFANAACYSRSVYPDAYRAASLALLGELVQGLKDRAKALANVRARQYFGYEPDGETRIEDNEASRIMAVSNDDDIKSAVEILGVARADIPAYDLDAMRDAIRAAYAKYNSPERVKARAKSAKRQALTKLQTMAAKFMASDEPRAYRAPSIARANPRANEVIAQALASFPDEASRIMARIQAHLAQREADMTHDRLNPDAEAIRWQRRYGDNARTVTREQWEAGANGRIANYDEQRDPTLVRRNGDELETSRGARVPFKRAVQAFLVAQEMRATKQVWTSPPNHAFKLGAFSLNRIEADGSLRAGCHTLTWGVMLALALREVPHLVKATYPVPALIEA